MGFKPPPRATSTAQDRQVRDMFGITLPSGHVVELERPRPEPRLQVCSRLPPVPSCAYCGEFNRHLRECSRPIRDERGRWRSRRRSIWAKLWDWVDGDHDPWREFEDE
jgi:hypothetical protein